MKKMFFGISICLLLYACGGSIRPSNQADRSTYALVKDTILLQMDSADLSSLRLSLTRDLLLRDSIYKARLNGEVSVYEQSLSSIAVQQGDSLAMDRFFRERQKRLMDFKLIEEPMTAGVDDKKPSFINEALPSSYVQRSYLKNPAALSYDIYKLPGRLVERTEEGNYELVTIYSNLLMVPQQAVLTNEILYCNKINNGASFNGKILIGGISVEKERMMELIIQDVAKTILPSDSIINDEKLQRTLLAIPEARRQNIYFIEGAVLTVVNYRKYNKTKFKAGLNTNWITADKQTYSSDESFRKERLVSLDLVKIDRLIQ